MVLASVFAYTSFLAKMDSRSANWNSAMTIAEAGIEEALTQLHVNGPGGTASGFSANMSADEAARSRKIHRLLDLFADHPTVVLSGTKMAEELGVPRSTLRSWIVRLRDLGVDLQGLPAWFLFDVVDRAAVESRSAKDHILDLHTLSAKAGFFMWLSGRFMWAAVNVS